MAAVTSRVITFETALKGLQDTALAADRGGKTCYADIQALVIGMSNYFWMRNFSKQDNRRARLMILSWALKTEITTTYDLSRDQAIKIRRYLFNWGELSTEGRVIFERAKVFVEESRVLSEK